MSSASACRRARLLAVQQMQEMRGDRIVVGFHVDAAAVTGEMPPVQQHRAEARHEFVGDVARFRGRMAVSFGQYRSQHRTARAHHVHRMRVGGHQFQRVLHDRRQAAQALQLGLVGLELRGRRQHAVDQQVRDFLEGRARRQVVDVVAAVMQVVAAAPDRAQARCCRRRCRTARLTSSASAAWRRSHSSGYSWSCRWPTRPSDFKGWLPPCPVVLAGAR